MKKILGFIGLCFILASGLMAETMQVAGIRPTKGKDTVTITLAAETGSRLTLAAVTQDALAVNKDTKVTVDQTKDKNSWPLLCVGVQLSKSRVRGKDGQAAEGPVKLTVNFGDKAGNSLLMVIADPKLYTPGQTYQVHVSQ